MPAPSKFTKVLGNKILKEARAGVTVGRAAKMHGIHPNTLLNWRYKGRKLGKGAQYLLDIELTKAEEGVIADAEKRLRQLRRDVQHGFNATKFTLERLAPEQYGQKKTLRIEVDTALTELLDKAKPLMTTAAFGELVKAVSQIHGTIQQDNAGTIH